MLTENEFYKISDAWQTDFFEKLEAADEKGALDVELQSGILTITLPDQRQLVISKHGVSRQLWLASFLSGGLHFAYVNENWALPDGRTLDAVIRAELKQLAGVSV